MLPYLKIFQFSPNFIDFNNERTKERTKVGVRNHADSCSIYVFDRPTVDRGSHTGEGHPSMRTIYAIFEPIMGWPSASVIRWWNKKLPNFHKKMPKRILTLLHKSHIITSSPKSHQNIWATFYRDSLLTRTCKNGTIWSLCHRLLNSLHLQAPLATIKNYDSGVVLTSTL